MNNLKPIEWGPGKLRNFKRIYADATLKGKEYFMFEGLEFFTQYAGYLIEYLDDQFRPERNSPYEGTHLMMDSERLSLLRSIGADKYIANHDLIAEAVSCIDELRKPKECGCGDIRPFYEFCHICGKCQTGCCMCVSRAEFAELALKNARLTAALKAFGWSDEGQPVALVKSPETAPEKGIDNP